MTPIPVTIICGLLGSGKTTMINKIIRRLNKRVLVIQAEEGEVALKFDGDVMKYDEINPKELKHQFERYIYDEIIIEWNGMSPLQSLLEKLLSVEMSPYVKVKRIIYVANEQTILYVRNYGSIFLDAILNADYFYLTKQNQNLVKQLKQMNGDAAVVVGSAGIDQMLKRQNNGSKFLFIVTSFICIVMYLFRPLLRELGLPMEDWLNVLTGLLIEGVPFLVIGSLFSALIQALVPDDFVMKYFPKKTVPSMLMAIIMSMIMPVCDCAVVPMFLTMLRKKVPHVAAVTYLCIAPLLNPFVLFSTYLAFGYDLSMMAGRCICGIIAACLIGGIVGKLVDTPVQEGAIYNNMCRCCLPGTNVSQSKVSRWLNHGTQEFLKISPYFLFGAILSSFVQMEATSGSFVLLGWPISATTIVLMIVAFLLCMCSMADAVIGKSLLYEFPKASVMGFLVFGPMMDLKSYLCLSSFLEKRYVRCLTVVMAVVSFFVSAVYGML